MGTFSFLISLILTSKNAKAEAEMSVTIKSKFTKIKI